MMLVLSKVLASLKDICIIVTFPLTQQMGMIKGVRMQHVCLCVCGGG